MYCALFCCWYYLGLAGSDQLAPNYTTTLAFVGIGPSFWRWTLQPQVTE